MLHRLQGNLDSAVKSHQQALDLAREIASPLDEARALAGLGPLRAGRWPHRRRRGRPAAGMEIFQRIGAAETIGVAAELEALSAARPIA